MCLDFIRDSIKCLYKFDQELKDFDENFLSTSDKKILSAIAHLPNHKWNTETVFRSIEVASRYKDELEECNIDFQRLVSHSPSKESLADINSPKLIAGNDYLTFSENSEAVSRVFSNNNFPVTLNNIYNIAILYLDKQIRLSSGALFLINTYINNLEYKDSVDFNFDHPIDSTLKGYQKVFLLFQILNRRSLLGDEMGLGKTLQSLAATIIAGKKKTLIICSSSLKLIWVKEGEKFFPEKNFFALGRRVCLDGLTEADFVIVNYESLFKYRKILKDMDFDSVIFDEIHYIKNSRAKRTKVCLDLVKGVDFKIGLTGTPIVNRPIDLVNQMDALDRLQEFGGFWEFAERYCPNDVDRVNGIISSGYHYDEDAMIDLHEKIRGSFYLRRTKKQVLADLPDKQRSFIPIDLSNHTEYSSKIAEYYRLKDEQNRTRSDLYDCLEEARGLLSKGKIESVIEIVRSFIDSGQKLVVFCYYEVMRNALVEEFPEAAHILSTDSPEERSNQEDKFQHNDDCLLMISTIRVGYCGFTLSSAHHVLFAEMDWCPSVNEQAEDRCHRIGTKESVNIWYVYVPNTMDDNIIEANKLKSSVISGISKNQGELEFSVLDREREEMIDAILAS